MIGLRGAKVLLVDDTLEEALPVIKACAKKGIPVAYFDGNINDLPADSEKLSGVRLAILDMDLVGAGDTDENKVSTLIARLQAILDTHNGLYTMIAWTKHAHLIGLLDQKLFTLFRASSDPDKVPLPVFCVRLEKKDFKNDAGVFNIDKLSSTIETELTKYFPMAVMQAWEERCSRAATGVTNSLSDLLAPQGDNPEGWRENWNRDYLKVLTSLAKEEVGDDNLNAETFYKALFGALNPLQVDFLESDQSPLPGFPDGLFPLPKAENNPLAGKINTKLHISFQGLDQFGPGNIYKLVDCAETVSITPNRIFEDLVQAAHKENAALFSRTIPIMLEVSASCDYAQSKIKFARFVAGLIVPKNDSSNFKQPSYKQPLEALLSLEPLWIEEQDRRILLSSQYLISLELDRARPLRPFARLRSQWLTSVQFWLAQQLSRPGIVMLK